MTGVLASLKFGLRERGCCYLVEYAGSGRHFPPASAPFTPLEPQRSILPA